MPEEKQDSEHVENSAGQGKKTGDIDITRPSTPRIPPVAFARDEIQRGLLEATRAQKMLDSFGGIKTIQMQIQKAMQGLDEFGYFDRINVMQSSIQASMRAISGAFDGISSWQKGLQESMQGIARIGLPKSYFLMQDMLTSSPFQHVLDQHTKTWLDYSKAFSTFDSLHLQLPHLETLTRALQAYDSRIEIQVEAFRKIPSLRPYQKRALIAHEERQQQVKLGPADLDNTELIAKSIDSTQSLINGIAQVDDDTEQELYPALEEETFDVLAKEGPEYPIPLRGAIQSASSDNPDKARQTIASLRELTTHLLHKLSPDDEIRKWSSNPKHYVEKRPTRACRLEYIFRDCSGSTLKPFIDNEVKFAKDFFELLNKGTHSLDTQLTENDLRYAICKTESLILLLLKYARR